MARVLVLGANGFTGRHLVAALVRQPGILPVALVRSSGADLPAGVETHQGDATDPATLRWALAGATHAVNCIAGPGHAMVAVTRALCAEGAALETVVHLSSMAVYGPAEGLVAETQPLDPVSGDYAAAKVACERLLGPNAVILRPGCIHGPGSAQWTARIARLLRRHRVGDLGPAGDGACNLTYIADLVQAVLAALQLPEARGRAFNVSDPAPGTWNDYFMRFGQAIGAVPVSRISARWLQAETRLLAPPLAAAARLRVALPDAIPPSLARLWQQDIVLDHRQADATLGFPRTAPAQALAAAADWVRLQG